MTLHASVKAWIANHRDDILDANRRLVRIASENMYPVGNELRVQLEARAMLEAIGFGTDLFFLHEVPGLTAHEAYLEGRKYDNRPNVVGIRRGVGGGRSLLFSGHIDTAPLGSERWTRAPFEGEVAEGKQYGLGIYDMKSGIVAAMMAARCLRELGAELRGDLLIECVADEEFGGANGTLAARLRGYEADAAIIPEPTNMAVCPVNQGGVYYRALFESLPGRSYDRVAFERASGRPLGGERPPNPVAAAARFVDVVRRYGEWRAERGRPALFAGQSLPTIIQGIHAGDTRFDLGDREPSCCYVDVWLQIWPGTTEEAIYREFTDFVRPLVEGDDVLSAMPPRFERKMRFLPGTGIAADHPIVGALTRAGRQASPNGLPLKGAPFACDSFVFNLYSRTPAVIFGPAGGNAHGADEYILVDEFMTLVEIYALAIADWCGIAGQESRSS